MASGEMFDCRFIGNYGTARQLHYAQRCTGGFCVTCDQSWLDTLRRSRGVDNKLNLISRERNVKNCV